MRLFNSFRRNSKPSIFSNGGSTGNVDAGNLSDLVQHARENVWNTNAGGSCSAESFSLPSVQEMQNFDRTGRQSARSLDALRAGSHSVAKDSLPESVKNSFTDGNYDTIVTDRPVTLYRSHGGKAYSDGSYWTLDKPGDPMEAKMDTALLQEWGNSKTYTETMTVPAGTKMNIGTAAPQESAAGQTLPGGVSQVLLDQGYVENHPELERSSEPLNYQTGYGEFNAKAEQIEAEAAAERAAAAEENNDGPDGPDNDGPDGPDNDGPDGPDNDGPDGPDNDGPDGPDNDGPDGPDNDGPDGPDNDGPDGPDNDGPDGPDNDGPDGPDN
ncbi:MAG: hypothetical protein K1W34_13085, partial [Lachnospiraceae bacterium]